MNDNKKLKLNWTVRETIGVAVINPGISIGFQINSIIDKYKKLGMNEYKFREMIKECFEKAPKYKSIILNHIEEKFPEHKEIINKYRILL